MRGIVFVDRYESSSNSGERLAYVWLRTPQEVEWFVTRAHGSKPVSAEARKFEWKRSSQLAHCCLAERWAESMHAEMPLHVVPISVADWVCGLSSAVQYTEIKDVPRQTLAGQQSDYITLGQWQAFVWRLPYYIKIEEHIAECETEAADGELARQRIARANFTLRRLKQIQAAVGQPHSVLDTSLPSGASCAKQDTIYIGGIPPEVDIEALKRMLGCHGVSKDISFLRLFPAKEGFLTAYGLVRFTAIADAMKAVQCGLGKVHSAIPM